MTTRYEQWLRGANALLGREGDEYVLSTPHGAYAWYDAHADTSVNSILLRLAQAIRENVETEMTVRRSIGDWAVDQLLVVGGAQS